MPNTSAQIAIVAISILSAGLVYAQQELSALGGPGLSQVEIACYDAGYKGCAHKARLDATEARLQARKAHADAKRVAARKAKQQRAKLASLFRKAADAPMVYNAAGEPVLAGPALSPAN
jgi:hypothetical protein